MCRVTACYVVAATVFLLACTGNARAESGNTVVNAGFETPEETHSTLPAPLPAVFGDWNGNWSGIVGSENGIDPADGSGELVAVTKKDSLELIVDDLQGYFAGFAFNPIRYFSIGVGYQDLHGDEDEERLQDIVA